MNLRTILAVLSLGMFGPAAFADSVTPDQAKQAVQRALPFLMTQKDKAIREGITGTSCMSCHWAASAIFSFNLIHQRGLLERKEVEKFDALIKKQSTRKLAYQINDATIKLLKTAGVPDDKLAVVKKKNQPFWTPKDLRQELAKDVAPAILDKHEAEIVKLTVNPNYYEVGTSLQSASILLVGASAATSSPEVVSKGLVERLLRVQRADGSFRNEPGQPFFPCDNKDEIETHTLWAVLGLRTVEPKSPEVARSLERANAYLLKTKPGKSTITLLLRAVWAHGIKDAPRVAEYSSEFLKQQRSDGGWSTWNYSTGDHESDAWATGVALYALGVLGRNATDPNVQRAWAFLIENQESDGGWIVTNSKGKAARIWTYWGTSWATVGLLETLPK